MRRTRLIPSALLSMLMGMGIVHAAPASAPTTVGAGTAATESEATASLNATLARLNSLEANFNQTTTAVVVKGRPAASNPNQLRSSHLGQTFSGVMQVKRQGLFRWETTVPSKQLIVTTGKTVWIYDPDLQQATRQTLDAQISDTPALLLSGKSAEIMKSYKVTQPDRTKSTYVLYPKAKDGVFQSLTVRFDAGVPTQMLLLDSLGQQTVVNFSNAKLNPVIANSQFEFTPPKGVDVIDQ